MNDVPEAILDEYRKFVASDPALAIDAVASGAHFELWLRRIEAEIDAGSDKGA